MGGDNALKEKVMSRTRIFLVIYMCFLFAAIYVPVGNGLFFLMSVSGLFLSLLTMNKDTMAVSLILFSGHILGLLFSLWSIPVPGFVAAVCIGFLLAKQQWHLLLRERVVIISMVCIFLMFIFSYFMGPMHAYSKEKIISILVVGTTSAFSWLLLLRSKKIDVEGLVQFLLMESLVYIAIAIDLLGWSRPSSLWDFDFIRISFYQSLYAGDDTVSYHLIGLNALAAVAFLISKTNISYLKNIFNILMFAMAIMIIIASQARQAIFGTVLIILFRVFIDKELGFAKKILYSSAICVVLVIGLFSIDTQAMDNSLSAKNSAEFFNRDYKSNLEHASIGSTFGGSGLGGYSLNGERNYPHNLFIELYGETGVFGIVFLFFVLLISWLHNISSPNKISMSKFYLIIPVVVFFVRAMASSDLGENIKFISAITVLFCIDRRNMLKNEL